MQSKLVPRGDWRVFQLRGWGRRQEFLCHDSLCVAVQSLSLRWPRLSRTRPTHGPCRGRGWGALPPPLRGFQADWGPLEGYRARNSLAKAKIENSCPLFGDALLREQIGRRGVLFVEIRARIRHAKKYIFGKEKELTAPCIFTAETGDHVTRSDPAAGSGYLWLAERW